jgi:hypothetical protein
MKINGYDIVTVHEYPPIPYRGFDWCAHLDSYDGAEDAGHQPVGWGATEKAAIEDLLEQLGEEEANDQLRWDFEHGK